jgi:hypothetical protein
VVDIPKKEGTSCMHWVVPSQLVILQGHFFRLGKNRKKRIFGVNRGYRVWPGIEPGTSRKLSFRVYPKRESYR